MSPRPIPSRPHPRLRALTAVAALAATVPLGAVGTAEADPAAPSLRLEAPAKLTVFSDHGRVFTDLGLRVIAEGAPFELRTVRPSYDDGLVVTATQGERSTVLPAGSTTTFGGLDNLVRLRLQRLTSAGTPTGTPTTVRRTACIGEVTERDNPDAAPTSPYPQNCYYNPYSLGAVQGVQEGWSASLIQPYTQFRAAPGRYEVTIDLRPKVAAALGIEDPTTTVRLTVKDAEAGHGEDDHGHRPGGVGPRPAGRAPSGPATAPAVDGPQPDLRSLPAWGIQVSPSGKYLQFSATVWNAGDSPLVVDGFRRSGEDVMDGYQYFFDADGQQVGYSPVGSFEWDGKPTHQHWHFRDFASYTLLRADRTAIVKSRKEAFCLANTDAVDLTVEGADWKVYSDDLTTACGEYTSRSIREVLSAGWGDTYGQFRAGQSFRIDNLPNGVYYIEVKGNPNSTLVESDETNNVSLRRIVLGGTGAARTVKVEKVGRIEEPDEVAFGRPGHP
ncbi:lysyl oxidase family protein [Nocardioides sp.]|uniref:lysyl oxidase family protein n=1 Tax=Nocardioides sp. TaxID=35761 RepID=UPI0035139A47